MRFRALVFALCCVAFTPSAALACRFISPDDPERIVQEQIARTPDIFRFEIIDAYLDDKRHLALRARVTERIKGEAPDIVTLYPVGFSSCAASPVSPDLHKLAASPDRPEVLGSGVVMTTLDPKGEGYYPPIWYLDIGPEKFESAFAALKAAAEAAPEASPEAP